MLGWVDRNVPVAEIAAKKIIEIGATGARDPAEISKLAVEQLGIRLDRWRREARFGLG
ncbi:hypothetical protein [Bradyrhizobium sp. Rc2d]|uniref:hypothetical protein n=1 Tax=Bradyrhizobium sp. Rc2d TaxID=1855321 RepID=UPI000AAB520E|nr:hypothetical protein [Bradyrhizobium sp. Rc2d]